MGREDVSPHSVPGHLVSWCRSGPGFSCRWVFICRPLAAFCCLPCKWPLSAKPGRSFLWPFPPSQARFLSEPALHVRGYSPCRKGRLAAPRLFLFLWRLWLGAARCWKGLEGYSPGAGGGALCSSSLFPLIKHGLKRWYCFADFAQSQDHLRKKHSRLSACQCFSQSSVHTGCLK